MAKTWRSGAVEEKIAALENAFRAIASRNADGVTVGEATISGIGRQLWLMASRQSRDDDGRTRWPVSQAGLKKARAHILKAAKAIKGVTPEAAFQMGLSWGALAAIQVGLEEAAKRAKPALGTPRKDQARRIAEVAAGHYWALTGKKPTVPKREGEAYGPFLDLVTAVFKILEVKASPLSAAESASRRWNSSQRQLGIGYGI
jgi:hypothetical protein